MVSLRLWKGDMEGIIQHKLKSKHSCDVNAIPSCQLKQIFEEISEPLTFLINQSIRTGIFPDALKIIRVSLLKKAIHMTHETTDLLHCFQHSLKFMRK